MSLHVGRGTMVTGHCRGKQRTLNNKVLEGKQKTPCKQVPKPGTCSSGRQEKRAEPSSYWLSVDEQEPLPARTAGQPLHPPKARTCQSCQSPLGQHPGGQDRLGLAEFAAKACPELTRTP